MCRCHRADHQDESGMIRLVQDVVQATAKISMREMLEEIPAIVPDLVREIVLASPPNQSDAQNARGDQQKSKGGALSRCEADHAMGPYCVLKARQHLGTGEL